MVKNLTQQAILDRFDQLGLSKPREIERHASYVDLLRRWNKVVNLTSLQIDPLVPEAIDRLVIEPVVSASLVTTGQTVTDIGTGGGSPALPFAVESKASELTMVESRTKKCAFLREAARVLEIQSTTVEARFEDAASIESIRSGSHFVTVRAVRIDAAVLRLVEHVLEPQGRILRFATREDELLPERMAIISKTQLIPGGSGELQTVILV